MRLKNAVILALDDKAVIVAKIFSDNGGNVYGSGFDLVVSFIGTIIHGITKTHIVGVMVFSIVIVIILTLSLTITASKVSENGRVDGSELLNEGKQEVYNEPLHEKIWNWFVRRKSKPIEPKPTEPKSIEPKSIEPKPTEP